MRQDKSYLIAKWVVIGATLLLWLGAIAVCIHVAATGDIIPVQRVGLIVAATLLASVGRYSIDVALDLLRLVWRRA